MSTQDLTDDDAVVIKKYANRRLYNTSTSAYVTLDDLAEMVKAGTDFVVFDAKSGDDITRSVLTQIIFEEESKGQNLLPINFLRQLIRFYGDSMQAFVPSFLEFSLDSLAQEQEKFREQMMEIGGEPFRAMEDQAQRNMAMFQQAMQMFNPFSAMAANGERPASGPGETPAPAAPAAPAGEELKELKDQLSALQRQLDTITKSK